MKKTIKKLSLNKMTISNLSASEMNQKFGGANAAPNSILDACPKSQGPVCNSFNTVCCKIDWSIYDMCPKKP